MPFRFLEHTADVRVECWGETSESLLQSSAQALYAIAMYASQTRADVQQTLELSAETREELLVYWLQELIFLMEVRYFVATVFHFDESTATHVRATALGYVYDPRERATEIKAATYHGMTIREEDRGLVAEITFDL